jgi:hypothetical protein
MNDRTLSIIVMIVIVIVAVVVFRQIKNINKTIEATK